MDSVTLTIDGRPHTVPKGITVLQAAIEAGVQVPYYCYHPGLGIDASCRVCLVKIEKMPKLQTSCSTPVAEGMIVHTRDSESIEARAGVFEFLLLNHPLDCPVCDKGGECPLQDFSYRFGNAASRMDFPRRTFDGEGVRADVDFGPTLMLNRNRCILCTRCVRFMREIDGDAQIGITDRGNGSEIATFNEHGVHSLLSGNLMDVCPVGAITTRQYRFRSRPWDNPRAVDTVCTLCAKGCSTTGWIKAKPEWAKGAQLIRMTPRYNAEVNEFWMCDIGRFGYTWVEGDARLRQPSVLAKNGTRQVVPWSDALARARDLIDGAGRQDPASVRFVTSAHASHEELFLLRQLADLMKGEGGSDDVYVTWSTSPKAQPADTKFKVSTVDAPNVAGARALGLAGAGEQPRLTELQRAVDERSIGVLYVVDPGPMGSLPELDWIATARQDGRIRCVIYQGVQANALAAVADVVLPGTAWVEKNATYTNEQGLLQGASRVINPPGEAVEDWQILASVGLTLGLPVAYRTSDDVRAAIGQTMGETASLAGIAGYQFNPPLSLEHWLQSSNPMERWKWNVMFQDLPPVKGHNVQMEGARQPMVIPLTVVTPESAPASE